MSDQPKCEICGEPMPPGEEVFKFHGYSGNCPKPPLKPTAAKYRKKPVIVEAMQWNGPQDDSALSAFAGHWASIGAEVYITTQEGAMRVSPGDFVIRGVKGEYYPCKPDIFEATYERVK